MTLNVEIGCNQNGNPAPLSKYEKCGSCSGVTCGRVPLKGDCSKFCKCFQGQHTEINSCPNGLQFNAKRETCDFPENAGCSSLEVSPPPPTDDFPYCESCSGINYGFVAFEKDCSKMCECLYGEVIKVKECENGLLFNKANNNCDYPANTDCQERSTDSGSTDFGSTPFGYTDSTDSTSKTPSGSTASTPTTVTPVGNECIECSSIGYGVVGNRYDCRKFCICLNHYGVQVETCSEGLYFNRTTELCEFDTEFKCSSLPTIPVGETDATSIPESTPDATSSPSTYRPESTPDVTSRPETTPKPTTPTISTTPKPLKFPTRKPTTTSKPITIKPGTPDGTDGNCELCNKSAVGTLVAIEGDCTKYCVCQFYHHQGKNEVVTCPGDLYFNPKIQICDWPMDSGCVQA